MAGNTNAFRKAFQVTMRGSLANSSARTTGKTGLAQNPGESARRRISACLDIRYSFELHL
jgi:hypothetical protein